MRRLIHPAFEVHFRRSSGVQGDYSHIGVADTLEGARGCRAVSGDLVVHADTHKIVTDPGWLFPWEQGDPKCHAQQAIRLELGKKEKR